MVTIADVAERAGVSRTTVSHALSGKRPVAPETRKRIAQVIEELDFRPNALARGLRIQHTQMVALIIPDITNPFYPQFTRGLQDTLTEHEYYTFLYNTDYNLEQETHCIADAIQRKADGIVIASHHRRTHESLPHIEGNIPFVSFGSCFCHPLVDLVLLYDQAGVLLAIHHLVAQGHRRIALLCKPLTKASGKSKMSAYSLALQQAAIPFNAALVVEAETSRSGGIQAMRTLLARCADLKRDEQPTAVFCAHDQMALGAMDAVQAAGLSVPTDMAIVGYGNLETASPLARSLTMVTYSAYAAGQTAGQLLVERMDGLYEGPGRHMFVLHQLLQGTSTQGKQKVASIPLSQHR